MEMIIGIGSDPSHGLPIQVIYLTAWHNRYSGGANPVCMLAWPSSRRFFTDMNGVDIENDIRWCRYKKPAMRVDN